MKFYINDTPVSESYFWPALEGLAGPSQIDRLLSGIKLVIGGISYQVEE